MATPNFDTDAFIQAFIAHGVPENQARAIVRGILDAQNELVTKRDMSEAMKDLETRLLIKLPAIIAALLALFTAAQKYFVG
jgi:hypothetical protein